VANSSKFKEGEGLLRDNIGQAGILMDISGGGIKFKTQENVIIDDILVFDLQLSGIPFVIMGQVVRSDKDEAGNHICGLSYIEINERIRDKIIQHIFEIMRKQSKTV
jgi:c-di-GMP-binding flagellar brake protein YcgR